MGSLRACPFCRELYDASEAARCRVCGVELASLAELPPSFEARERAAEQALALHPDDRTLARLDLRRGKGALLLLATLGVALFFAPWIEQSAPRQLSLSGAEFAASKSYWFSAGALGWFISLPLVWTRRSVNQLRGVRVIVTLFAGLTAAQLLLLWWLAPTSAKTPLAYHWAWGCYASFAVSALGTAVATRLGGSATPITHAPYDADLGAAALPVQGPSQTSAESRPSRTLH